MMPILKWIFLPQTILWFSSTTGMSNVGGLDSQSSEAAYTNADVILLLTYILLALIFSFLCSIAEAVLLSTTPSFIAGLIEKKSGISNNHWQRFSH